MIITKNSVSILLAILIFQILISSCKSKTEQTNTNQVNEGKMDESKLKSEIESVDNLLSKKFMIILPISTLIPASSLINSSDECITRQVVDGEVEKILMKNCNFSPFIFSGEVTSPYSNSNMEFFKGVSVFIQDGPVILENGEFDIEVIQTKIAVYNSIFEIIPFSSEIASKYTVSMRNIILSFVSEEGGMVGIKINFGNKSFISIEEKVLGEKIEIVPENGSFSVFFQQSSSDEILININGKFTLSGCSEFSGNISGEKLKVNIGNFFRRGYICPTSGKITTDNTEWNFSDGKITAGSYSQNCEDIKICL